jgi:hypothetical protein
MKNRVTLYIPKMKKCSNKEPMMQHVLYFNVCCVSKMQLELHIINFLEEKGIN